MTCAFTSLLSSIVQTNNSTMTSESPQNVVNNSSLFSINVSSTLIENSSWTANNLPLTNFTDGASWINQSTSDHTLHQSTPLISALSTSDTENEVVLIGWPGPMFYAIHGVALCCLSTTILISLCLLIFVCLCRNKGNNSHNETNQQKKRAGQQGIDVTSSDGDSLSTSQTTSTTTTTTDERTVNSSETNKAENRSKMVAARYSTTAFKRLV